MSIFDSFDSKKQAEHLAKMTQIMTDNYVRECDSQGFCTLAELFKGTDLEDRYKNVTNRGVQFKKFQREEG